MSTIALNKKDINRVIKSHEAVLSSVVTKIVDLFKEELSQKKGDNSLVDNRYAVDQVVQLGHLNMDEYLQSSINDLKNETGIENADIVKLGKDLDKNIFELVRPQYIPINVGKVLGINNKNEVTRIAEDLQMFESKYFVTRNGRAVKGDQNKSSTTVLFTILGIIYMGYLLKNSSDYETVAVFNNKKTRDEIIDSLIAYEKGDYDTFSSSAELMKSIEDSK